MNAKPMTPRMRLGRRQAGTSLVEILIAMVIALFIMSGVVVMFVNMQKTFTSQDQLAQLQDSERLTLTILTNVVQQAGFFPNPLVNTALGALPASGSLAAGQVITGTSGASAGQDTLTTQLATASGDGNMNCLGQANTTGSQQVYVNTLSISPNNELQCTLTVSGGTPTTVPLVSGVSGLTVLYGTDTNGNGYSDTYLTAAQVTAGGYWSSVHSVQVKLQFATQFGNQVGQTNNSTWVQTISLKNQQ